MKAPTAGQSVHSAAGAIFDRHEKSLLDGAIVKKVRNEANGNQWITSCPQTISRTDGRDLLMQIKPKLAIIFGIPARS